MLRNVLLFGDEILRRKAAEISAITPEVRRLAADMLETMYYHDGLGLAAPQVGVPLRLFVMDVPREGHDKLVCINPVVGERGPMRRMDEGCLSFPGVTGTVARAAEVTIEFTDLSGARRSQKVAGVTAQAVQHELDHLDGTLYTDRLTDPATYRPVQAGSEEAAELEAAAA